MDGAGPSGGPRPTEGWPGGAARSRRDRVLDAALDLGAETGWHDLRLRAVAARLGLALPDVLAEFRDADAVADAHFARALAAMLAPPADPAAFAALPPSARAAAVLTRWFAAQAPRRAVAGQMIREKLWPSHPHHWVPMVFSLSRLIHWVREAALLDAGGLRRQAEEVGLTLAFLSVLPVWVADGSAGQVRTRAALARRLGWLDAWGRGA